MVQRGLHEPDLHTLRALTAVAVTYRAVLRSDSSVSTQPPDVYVERVPPGADLACQVCGRTDREDSMVLCDRCDHGVHADCAGLPGVPAGDWCCRSCQQPGHFPRTPHETRWLVVRVRQRKGQTHLGLAPAQRYSLRGWPDLARLVERYQQLAAEAWEAEVDEQPRRRMPRADGRARGFFFQLPGERRWNCNIRLTEWLDQALQVIAWQHTEHYTSHSVRRGAASTAAAVGVPLPLLEAWGGWSRGSTALAQRYLDPTVQPSPDTVPTEISYFWYDIIMTL